MLFSTKIFDVALLNIYFSGHRQSIFFWVNSGWVNEIGLRHYVLTLRYHLPISLLMLSKWCAPNNSTKFHFCGLQIYTLGGKQTKRTKEILRRTSNFKKTKKPIQIDGE